MKVGKDGNVKLEKGEVRIGNFFVKLESETDHIKIKDLNSCFSFRVWTRLPIGIWLSNMYDGAISGKKGAIETLKVYISTMWSVFSVAPDDEYIEDAIGMAKSALERHPDWYGVKNDATPEEEADALEEVREMAEFEDGMRKLKEKDGEEGED